MATQGKIGCFIVSRTTSKRLPGKALRIIKGKPVIQHIIERAKLASSADVIVLCTSTDKSDDILETIAKENGIEVFRGSLEDVLARYLGAAEKFDVKIFSIFSGDNIFTDPQIIDSAVHQLIKNNLDFVNIPDPKNGLVCGGGCYCVSTEALKKVCQTKKDNNTEVIAPFFNAPGFKTQDLALVDPALHNPKIRLTMDYHEDLELVKRVFDEFNTDVNNIPLKRIVELLEQKPEILNINSFRQKDWTENLASIKSS